MEHQQRTSILKYLLLFLIQLSLTSTIFVVPFNNAHAQCTYINIDNGCTQYSTACAPTDFTNTCNSSAGWSPSNGTPNLIYVPLQHDPLHMKDIPAYYYLEMVCDGTQGEGAFIPFAFAIGQTYNVTISAQTSGTGFLYCYAASGLVQQQSVGCQSVIPNISNSQYIGQTANVSTVSFVFTANRTYTQLWLYASNPTVGPHFSAAVSGLSSPITICAVCNIPAPSGLSTSAGTSVLNWNVVPGAYSYNIMVAETYNNITTTTYFKSSTNSMNYCARASGDHISFTVQGVCANGSSVGMVSTPYTYTASYPTILPAPTGLTYTPPNTLSWQPVSGAGSYLVQVTQEPGGSIGAYTVTGTIVSGSNAELSTGVSYQVSVASQYQCATGALSSPISFTVPSCSPPSVAYVQNGTFIILNTDANAVSYNVGWRNTSGVIVYQVNNIGSVITTQGYQATGVPHGSFYVVAQANCTVGGTTACGTPYFGGLQTTAKKFPAVTMNSTEESGDSLSFGKQGMFVYPDPATTKLNIQYNTQNSGKADIIILSELGNQLMRKSVGTSIGNNNFSFDIGQLPNGVYFVRLIDANNTYVKKLVVQK